MKCSAWTQQTPCPGPHCLFLLKRPQVSPPRQSSKYYAVFPHHCIHLRSRTAFWSKCKFLGLPPTLSSSEEAASSPPWRGPTAPEPGEQSRVVMAAHPIHELVIIRQRLGNKSASRTKSEKPNHSATAPTPTTAEGLGWSLNGAPGPTGGGDGRGPQGGCPRQSRAAGATWA